MIDDLKGLRRRIIIEDAKVLERWMSLEEAVKSFECIKTKQKLYLIIRENNITDSFGGQAALISYVHNNQQHHFNRH